MRRVPLVAHLIVVALGSSLTTAAWSAVPSPLYSSIDPCLVICPRGDFVFHVTVRDFGNVPIPGSTVVIDFCVAPTLHVCAPMVCSFQGVTDGAGQVKFAIAAGGVTAPGTQATIRADGVPLASRPVASPDQDGSQFVDATDVEIGNSKLGAAHDYYHRLLTLAGDLTVIPEGIFPPGARSTSLVGEIWRNGASPLPAGSPSLVERFPRGGVPTPMVPEFLEAHWNEATPVSDPGNTEHWTLNAGGDPYRFFKTASNGSLYSIRSTRQNPSVTVSGLAIWLLDRGIRADDKLSISGAQGSALVIVAGKTTEAGPLNSERGFNLLGGLDSTIPIILVSDGIVDIEHRNNSTLAPSSMPFTSIYARDAVFMGPGLGTQSLAYAPEVGQVVDTLYAFGLLPNVEDATDPTMDLDCDRGMVDAEDLAVLQAHVGHACGGATPARRSSWGSIKTLYR